MGSAGQQPGSYADTAKRLAGRSLYAVGSGLVAGSKLVAKGVSALTADTGDKEPVRFLKFALVEWGGGGGGGGSGAQAPCRLPVLLVGLSCGFQVWRLDGANPAELLSRRDGPAKLVEALPEPRSSEGGGEDVLRGDRPLLAIVPAPEYSSTLAGTSSSSSSSLAAVGGTAAGSPAAPQQQQQHSLLLYSLRSHGYVRTLGFSGEILAVQASSRLLVVALRGQLQAFDACSLQHTFSCITYTPPTPTLLLPSGSSSSSGRSPHQQQQQQFVTEGLTSSGSSDSYSLHPHQPQQQRQQAGAAAAAAALAPFALGARWLAYATDTPVPQASGQAVAQRLPLARRDSASSSGGAAGFGGGGGGLEADGGMQLGSSPGGRANGLTKAAMADAAMQAASKGGQQLKAGLTAVGSAGYKYLSQQYATWRGQGQQQLQRDADALEADAAAAGTVVVRDAATRLVVAHFRAHTSPLAQLQFSPGGTLLATASVAGHSINLFCIVPPAAAAASGAADGGLAAAAAPGGTGHAVHLYRLYRGVTPAAIRGIAFAPDASWVAASSGRGTTHLFYTPAAAPGARQPHPPTAAAAAASATGVVGQPGKQLAVGRARKPGLLNGSMAGAATSAARSLYARQAADAAPIAAAFLASGPSSPKAAAPSAASHAATASSGSCSSLYVVTSDGLLTRHLLRAPPAATAQDASAAAASGGGALAAAPGRPGSANGGALGLDGQDPGAAGAAAAAAAVLEEADRWDVARHAGWPEREELLPGMLPGALAAELQEAAPAAAAAAAAGAAVAAEQQQLWVAQAEAGALAAPGAAAAAAAPLPLWQDPQFRFFQLQVSQLQRQQSPAPAGLAGEAVQPGYDDALAVQLEEAALGSGGGGSAGLPWLEHIPARPVQQHQ